MDRFNDFAELAKCTKEGRDYRVRTQSRPGTTVVIAPHGGDIEPGTSELAEAIAGDDLSFCAFEGIRDTNNWELHISSTRFDEPRCRAVVAASARAVAVHGEDSAGAKAFLGGRDQALLNRVRESLLAAGFHVGTHSNPNLQGLNEENICNRVQGNRGVQMELSKGLRSLFFESLTKAGRKTKTQRFEQFVEAVRKSVLYRQRSNKDLQPTVASAIMSRCG